MADTKMKLGQVAISVRDLDAAVRFYRDRVGLTFMFQAPNVAFFDCGGVRLMLGLNEEPEKKPYGTVLYYQIEHIHEVFDTLQKREIEVVGEPHLVARMADFDLWMAFLRDPDGNIFGIMEEVRDRET
jgi:catechol 2,3-dioxygenase-like lactoylglutathione lyase family enzyme